VANMKNNKCNCKTKCVECVCKSEKEVSIIQRRRNAVQKALDLGMSLEELRIMGVNI
jgi:hypothetical protein